MRERLCTQSPVSREHETPECRLRCTNDKPSDHEFAGVLQSFLETNFEHDPRLTNLADVVAWNEAHTELAMPERKDPFPIFFSHPR